MQSGAESMLFMSSIIKAWQSASLNTRIALFFLAITVASSLVIGLTSYRLSSNVITQASIEEARNATRAVAVAIESYFRSADQNFIGVYSDRDLTEILKLEDGAGDGAQSLRRGVQSAVQYAEQINNSIQYINIFGVNGFSYIDTYYNSAENRSFDACVEYFSELGLTEDRRAALWVPNQNVFLLNSNRKTISLVRYVREFYTLEIKGIMVMGISEASLSRQYQSVSSDVYIVQSDGAIVSHYDKSKIDTMLPYNEIIGILSSGNNLGTLSFYDAAGDRLFASYSVIHETGWYMLSIISHYDAFLSSYNLRDYIIAILLVTILASGLVLVMFSRVLTKSVNRLITAMKQAMAGDLSVRYEVSGGDSINKIGLYFNDMLKDIEENIDYKEKSERSARISDIKLLQSQINPHLLYNSLDSVLYHMEHENHENAADILQSMSTFFKLSLSQGDFLIPLEREIALIRNYLDIQRRCREKDIDLILSGDTNVLLHIMIPKMTLQPIVENAILHGFEGDSVRGMIAISMADAEEAIVISVEDNGSGIMYDELDQINAAIKAPHSGLEQKHYGLWNINQRIKDVFGAESGVVIQSEFGVYTKAVITLKKAKGEQGQDV